jgi:hypothetical protein
MNDHVQVCFVDKPDPISATPYLTSSGNIKGTAVSVNTMAVSRRRAAVPLVNSKTPYTNPPKVFNPRAPFFCFTFVARLDSATTAPLV